MSEFDEVAGAAEPLTMRIKLRHGYYRLKHSLGLRWHGLYWRALHLTRLAGPYSKAMCKLNLYRTFPDGRCMWCGNTHGVVK